MICFSDAAIQSIKNCKDFLYTCVSTQHFLSAAKTKREDEFFEFQTNRSYYTVQSLKMWLCVTSFLKDFGELRHSLQRKKGKKKEKKIYLSKWLLLEIQIIKYSVKSHWSHITFKG